MLLKAMKLLLVVMVLGFAALTFVYQPQVQSGINPSLIMLLAVTLLSARVVFGNRHSGK